MGSGWIRQTCQLHNRRRSIDLPYYRFIGVAPKFSTSSKPFFQCLHTHTLWAVAPTPQGTGACAPSFTNDWARGHREQKNSKQETDRTVLTITKALTKTTNCTFRAKKVEGTTSPPPKKKIPAVCVGSVPQLPNSFRCHWLWAYTVNSNRVH